MNWWSPVASANRLICFCSTLCGCAGPVDLADLLRGSARARPRPCWASWVPLRSGCARYTRPASSGGMIDPAPRRRAARRAPRPGEPLAGSASEAPLFAAVSWPKARWHPDKVGALRGAARVARRGSRRRPAAAGQRLQLRLYAARGRGAAPIGSRWCARTSRAGAAPHAARGPGRARRRGDRGLPRGRRTRASRCARRSSWSAPTAATTAAAGSSAARSSARCAARSTWPRRVTWAVTGSRRTAWRCRRAGSTGGSRRRTPPALLEAAPTRPRVPALLPRPERALGAGAGRRSRGAREGPATRAAPAGDGTRVSVAARVELASRSPACGGPSSGSAPAATPSPSSARAGSRFPSGPTPLRCRITACGSGSCWRRLWPSCVPPSERARRPSW